MSPSPHDRRPPPGAPKLDGYAVTSLLGKGGMGRVYKAEQEILSREVAIKVFSFNVPDDMERKEFLARFLNEAKMLARLKGHENIVQVYDVVKDSAGNPCIVMECVDGTSVADAMKAGGRPSVAESARIARETARALHHAHLAGIIHRDIKPENIMIAKGGRVKVMDFGIARAMDGPSMTRTGMQLGTPYFMSPEQIEGSRHIDGRSDVYALAVVLYLMATGHLPFEDSNVFSLANKHLTQAPPPPRTLAPGIPRELEAIILKGMAKKPADRYQSAEQFAEALQAIGASGSADTEWDWAAIAVANSSIAVKPVAPEPAAESETEEEPSWSKARRNVPPPGMGAKSTEDFVWPSPPPRPAVPPPPAKTPPPPLVPTPRRTPQRPDPNAPKMGGQLTPKIRKRPVSNQEKARASVVFARVLFGILGLSIVVAGGGFLAYSYGLFDQRPSGGVAATPTPRNDRRTTPERAPRAETPRPTPSPAPSPTKTAASSPKPTPRSTPTPETTSKQPDPTPTPTPRPTPTAAPTRQPRPTPRVLETPASRATPTPAPTTERQSIRPLPPNPPSIGPLLSFDAHIGRVTALAFSPSGDLIASAGTDDAARVWEAATKRRVAEFKGHGERVVCLAFAPDGDLVATGGADKMVRLWDPLTGEQVDEFAGHADQVTALAFSPDGDMLLAGARDGMAIAWQIDNPSVEPLALRPAGSVGEVVATRYVPSSGDGLGGALVFWQEGVAEWRDLNGLAAPTTVARHHGRRFLFVDATARLDKAVTYSSNREIRLWDLAIAGPDSARGHRVLARGVDAHSLALSADGSRLLVGLRGTVSLRDGRSGSEMFSQLGHARDVTALALHPAGGYGASGDIEGRVVIWGFPR